MDAQDRDESKQRRREETLARRIGQALDEMDGRNAALCPDGEILAAYAERALSLPETEKWESHFSSCARCRKILMVLAASSDTPLAEKEVVNLGELISAVQSPAEIKGKSARRSRPWIADWRTRWLAPAFGAAAVMAVWFAMHPPWRATDRSASQTLVAQAPKEEAPLSPTPTEADKLSRLAPRQKEEGQAAPSSERSSANAEALNSPVGGLKKVPAGAGNALENVSPNAGEAKGSLQQQEKLSGPVNGSEMQPAAISPAPPSPAKAQAETEASAARQSNGKTASAPAVPGAIRAESFAKAIGTPSAQDKQAGAPQAAASAPAVPAPAPQVTTRQRSIQGFSALKAAEPASIEATAPFGSTVWRLGKGGRIERSADGGETWISQTSPILEDWLAGVAVSDTVCWAAGSNGSIARTIDGERWERVAPPAMAAGADSKLPDWTGITARDAQSATITSRDGRKFATVDGGKTWKPQQ
jgi:hypothetical protein